jgi:hypothetical protein
MFVCFFLSFFLSFFVCMYLIQIHISEPIWTKLCTRLFLGLEETVGYVWVRNSWRLWPSGHFFTLEATAELWAQDGCRRDRFSRYRYICGSSWCSRDVTDSTFNRAAGPSATALHPSFQLLFMWPTKNHVLADESCEFLLQVCCSLGNVYDTLGRERDPCD